MDHSKSAHDTDSERYLLGEMDDAERDEFEERFFTCRECAEDVKTTVAFLDNARAVLLDEGGLDAARSPSPIEQPPQTPEPEIAAARILPMRRRIGSALALAAVLALAVTAGWQSFVTIPGLRRDLADTAAPQAVRWEFLSVSRSVAPTLSLSDRHRMVGFRLSRSSQSSFPEYRCDLLDAAGTVVQSALVPAPPEGEELGLVLPVAGLRPGSYVIVLSGLESPDALAVAPELARYCFELQFEEEETER
ncbi:MAG: hypothetical protein AAF725_04485 [Acidobacteriota bacterium]